MSKYGVPESVWLATAIKAFETFYFSDEPSKEKMYFKQTDIQKRAQEMCNQNVDNARISQWCNANHNNHTYNYLCAGDNATRRISYQGEFNGNKEQPKLNLDDTVSTSLGSKSVKEIKEFVKNDYTSLFINDNLSLHGIKCQSILDYLDEFGGQPYENPDQADPSRRENLLKIKNEGRAAVRKLDKMAELCDRHFGLKKYGVSKWLNGGGNRVRPYLWRQLKLEGYENCPTSVSLFAEIVEGKARFKFSVELNEAQSEEEDYLKHHRILNRDISVAPDKLIYILKGNNSKTEMRDLNLSTQEIKERVEDGTYNKVQLARTITRDDIDAEFHDDRGIIQGMLHAVEALMPYYTLAIGKEIQNDSAQQTDNSTTDSAHLINEEGTMKMFKNMILYGPPGTGKTYQTVIYAVAIIENKSIDEVSNEDYETVFQRYNTYKAKGKIAFTTFHQSYGYEEFIEGIKPQLQEDDSSENLEYKVEPGVFKKFCDKAKSIQIHSTTVGVKDNPTIWKVSLKGSGNNKTKEDCFRNNRIRIGWEHKDKVITEESTFESSKEKRILLDFQDEMEIGDIVLTLFDQEHIDGIGIVTGEAEWVVDINDHYHRSRNVQWIATGIKENILDINQGVKLTSSTIYRLNRIDPAAINNLLEKYSSSNEISVEKNKNNYVFIIDEINRGNISKIFGELITLIESTKRIGEEEQTRAMLPYSGHDFGVPNNVFILGTMNTADRSIALMDTALRRRFQFIEMMPNVDILSGIKVGRVDVMKMLHAINSRIEFLYDREHTIGHSYFIALSKSPTLEKLADIFRNSIIPLMQEYFYEDYNKIQLVLGDNNKEDEFKFIKDETLKINEIFKGSLVDIDLPEKKYTIQTSAFYKEDCYIKIYE